VVGARNEVSDQKSQNSIKGAGQMMSRTFFVQNIEIFAEKIVILGAEKCECAFFGNDTT
jgi:hypothetical protein